jgi:predicted dehydrogenase
MTTRPAVRWGFLGAGFVASRALAPAVHAADGAVLTVVGAREAGRAAALGPARATTDYAEVCAADDVDVVYVALPNDAHERWVLEALRAGKHVLCEKPLGCTAAEVTAMAAAAAAADRHLVEATWTRWHPRTRRMEELLRDAAPGRAVEAAFTFGGVPAGNYRLDPARGGGALLDVGPYVVGSALWALAAEVPPAGGHTPGPVTVRQAQRRRGPTGIDLETVATLDAPAGQASIVVAIDQPERQQLRIVTPGLTLEPDAPAFTSWRAASSLRLTHGSGVVEERFAPVDAYRLMVEAVSARVLGEDAWVLPLTASQAVAAALDAVAGAASG